MTDTTFAKVAEKLKDLPVNDVAANVVDSVMDGKVAILTAETGSGKTLLANSMLADASDDQVLVLVPRRFLAINAAETVAELGELTVGKEVGFAVGSQAGDRSEFGPETKLLFATYGYALASGLLESAKTIVADEVHEAGVDTSLARALLHKRMQNDPALRVVEMSATLDAKKQASFWEDISEVDTHHADGKAFPCDTRYVNPRERSVEQLAIDLITKENRKGIAVFRPGVGEVESTADGIRELAQQHGLTNVEVEAIYGDMNTEERERATRAPEPGNVKVLVGTNVIESGVNIKWLDTGISDGLGKVPYYRDTGAEALVLEDLPQWRIVQQEGRVKRFTDGVFVLAGRTEMEDREERQTPEIERMSLTRLVMRTANFGIDPTDLKYDGKVEKERLLSAKQDLQRLDLLTDDWKLTEKGEFAMTLPLGPEAAVMVHSAKPEHRDSAIELAAVVEVGGMRADYKIGHGMDDSSDIFDGLKAYKQLENREKNGEEITEEICAGTNVSLKRFNEVKGLVKDMGNRLERQQAEPVEQKPATRRDMQVMMLHGSVNRVFNSQIESAGTHGHNSKKQSHQKPKVTLTNLLDDSMEFSQSNSSVVGANNNPFSIGYLREIPSRRGEPVTILENVTKIPRKVFAEFAASRDGVLTDLSMQNNAKKRTILTGKYFGETPITFDFTKRRSESEQALIDRARGNAPSKPKGVANSNVREEQQHQQQARG